MHAHVSIQEADFDAAVEVAALTAADHGIGAVVQFTGLMRDSNSNSPVLEMQLEHYPGMTEKSIREIIAMAAQRWDLAGIRVIHRVGRLFPGQQIVFVAAASAHRQNAFDSCAFVMDYLKSRAPFWKKETLENGQSRWVDARSSDADALARWQTSSDHSNE